MKYIKNNLDYSVKFRYEENGKEKEYSFDCFRTYSDTGNVATTGVTAIEDADYELLCDKVKVFKKFIDNGSLSLTDKEKANAVASKIGDLEKENKELREKLAQKTEEVTASESEEVKKLKDANKAQEDEIKDLKAQLESAKKTATAKQSKSKNNKAEGDGENGGF